MIWSLMKIILVIAAMYACMFIAKALMRKVFNIKRVNGETTANNHVNQSHREIDRMYQDYAKVVLFIILIVAIVYFDNPFNLILIAFSLSTFIRMLIRAFFEWKYSTYPKQSILTLTEMSILLIAVLVILQFDLFY